MQVARALVTIAMGMLAGCLSVPGVADQDSGSADASTSGATCQPGTLDCPCTDSGTCLDPLACRAGLCIDDATSSSGSSTGSGATTGTTGTTADSTSGQDSTGASGSTSTTDDGTTTGPQSTHQIFVTSQRYEPVNDFQSVVFADALCQSIAPSDGNWVAVLRDSDLDFTERIEILGPVYRLDGALVAEGASDFFGAPLQYPIEIDETGDVVDNNERVWIGDVSANCSDWETDETSGRTVRIEELDLFLIGSGNVGCSTNRRLFCISQP